MITEIKLESWKDFEVKVASLAEKPEHLQPLFRGQKPVLSNEQPECHECHQPLQKKYHWPLDTSLEKYGAVNYSATEYYEHLLVTAEAIETVTGIPAKRWELSSRFEPSDSYTHPPQGYRFMTFLRQNGFPSPLLDWTRSPYVAAFFAFQRADPKDGEFTAIFEYLEDKGTKNMNLNGANIRLCGPWIGTDKKHFLQQSYYTVCRKGENKTLHYARHDEVFEGREEGQDNDEEQDILTRYLIPVSERKRVLQKLRLMNITPYSLFESTENLLELIASDVIRI
jgi:hypothetical protein